MWIDGSIKELWGAYVGTWLQLWHHMWQRLPRHVTGELLRGSQPSLLLQPTAELLITSVFKIRRRFGTDYLFVLIVLIYH